MNYQVSYSVERWIYEKSVRVWSYHKALINETDESKQEALIELLGPEGLQLIRQAYEMEQGG